MQGYRTFIVAGLAFIVPALAKWGFQVDPNALADAIIIVVPGLMAIMRMFTHTSPGEKS